jgi:ArsR family transcriptional regulator, arsenate/arsenite/antimonite-responsive transcriptional repressor / arsenate reductase (thioredoxin)
MITTNITPLPDFLRLLAHELRWQLLNLLSRSDYRVQELTSLLDKPQNLVSYHLRLLREGALVTERRSNADRRDIYYSLDMAQLYTLYRESGQTLHPALVPEQLAVPTFLPHTAVPHRFLFLCTHNSARSQLAEAFLRQMVPAHVLVQSAGSHPSTAVHPLAIRAAQELFQLDIRHQTPTPLAQIANETFDYVITVCDQMREVCPTFPATTQQIHWSLADPTAVHGSPDEQYQAFCDIAHTLQTRLQFLLYTLPHHTP